MSTAPRYYKGEELSQNPGTENPGTKIQGQYTNFLAPPALGP